jgi:addiction module HigA family antidote
MTEYEARRNDKRPPAHPGAILSEVFEGLGLTNTEIARRLGISRQHLLDVLAERKPVSANIAVRFGKFLGQNGGIWLRMQAAYDLWRAEHSVDLAQVVTWNSNSDNAKRMPKKGDKAV